jgi:hypothetical protein
MQAEGRAEKQAGEPPTPVCNAPIRLEAGVILFLRQ